MLFDDTYRTIEKPVEGLFRDRGSKFLAFAYPVNNETELKNNLTQLKAEHSKANHHCWAMRLTPDRSIFRINDDGEPSGTAGRPILNTLLSRDLTNLAVVVVRYFGGTLLGVPGLINAYKVATEEALQQAVIVEKTVNDIYSIEFNYLQMNDIMRLIKEDNLAIIEQSFDNNCSITVSIRKMQVNQTLAKISKLNGVLAKYVHSS
ncbi:IMPACT family protein [Mucilaginibacter flavidus]|uniref:IMPACT family protein n=1 Tax=Mucilaginibacter flavidus TaxID=2949309 RepID=UPI0020939430|nr:YigZ family protein [Mucilaginibacter flavidus]MCO5947842.1 IMPACT family protein [Mucilaginibacter flavidus]